MFTEKQLNKLKEELKKELDFISNVNFITYSGNMMEVRFYFHNEFKDIFYDYFMLDINVKERFIYNTIGNIGVNTRTIFILKILNSLHHNLRFIHLWEK